MKKPKLRFSEFHQEWKEITLGEHSSIIDGNYGEKYPKENEFLNDGVPFLTSAVIGNTGLFDNSLVKYISKEKNNELKKAQSKGNDIIITNRGASMGTVGIIPGDYTLVNIGPQLTRIRVNPKTISSKFIENYLRSFKVQKALKNANSGSAMSFVSLTLLKSLLLIVPSLEEQQKIGLFLNLLDLKIQKQQEKVELLKQQKKGLMQKIFSQELRFKDQNGQKYPEWEVEYLKNMVTFFDGQRKRVSESNRITGIYPYYGASGIVNYVNDYIFEGEYLLLSEDGANIVTRNLPIVYRTKGKFWLNNHAHIFKANESFSNNFLYHALEKINYIPYNSGTAQPKLNLQSVRNIELKVPSFDEQRVIGKFLNLIDNRIDLELQKMNQLYQQKQAFMQQIFI